ncbi:MAG: extracellular solute-binding protein [Nostoc sp. NMS7]|uniref:extracellular solute-binding protein n=1 Tax=Nostoc sp. NMS7 TaxID=2815391 RepID=UPI0025E7B275|nr:extracellular solute-binding protein [Nostoc sp. NMS7]MBN3946286.1 extracellular solute-binding protein [Nostoc sp. NMS7]
MKKYFLTGSLAACAFSVLIPNQAFAATLNLYGAGSLRNALTEVSQDFTQETGIGTNTVFGPSGIREQAIETELQLGQPTADVFASADIGNPQKLYIKGLSSQPVEFTQNQVVAVFSSKYSQAKITPSQVLDYLLNPKVKLGTSTPISDPLGDYTQQIFTQANSKTPGSFDTLNNKALRLTGGTNSPIVPSGQDSLVYFLDKTQQADVFLTYYTGAIASQKIDPSLQVVRLPDYLSVAAPFDLTVIKNADPNAQKLADYILSDKGQEILHKYGFTSPTKSVPEPNYVCGLLLTAAMGLALKKKLAEPKQKIQV